MKPLIAIIAITFVTVLFGCSRLNAADVSEQRKTELILAIGRNSFERVDNLPADEKRWLLEYIRNQRKVPGWAAAYELQLLQLGDEEAMERYVMVFDAYPEDSDMIALSRQPRLIERMAPTMFHDEPASFPQTADVYTHPRSISAAGIVAYVLSTSNEIPEAVRLWATDVVTAGKHATSPDVYGKMRGVMRQWWKDNKPAMRARNWAAVKPGLPITGIGKTAIPSPETPIPTPRPPPGSNGPQGTPPPAPLSVVESRGVSTDWIYYAIGGIVAVVALVVWHRMRGKHE